DLLVRLGICTALALNAMLFAAAEYFGMSSVDGVAYTLFRWLSAGIATLAVAVGGPVFFRAAVAGLKRRVLHLDLPIALGIGLGYGASAFAFVTGFGEAYFDSVTVFVALMLAGRFVQQRAVRQNRNFLLANDGTEHVRIRRLEADGSVERVLVDAIQVGDRLLLVPGDLVPVNAWLRDDAAALSLDWINGESEPRRFERDAEIPAGAFVAGRRGVVVEARANAADSGLHAMLAMPLTADGVQPGGKFWGWLNRIYVAAVLMLSAAAAIVWTIVDPSRAVDVVTAVLIVTCPCALGIATPLAVDLVLARLRRQGVFVRRGSLLDRARHVRRVVFDKTGTLTWGGVRVRELRAVPDGSLDALYTMASSSNHPVSRAIAEHLKARDPKFLEQLPVDDLPGLGLVSVQNGHELRLGSSSFTLGDAGETDDAVCVFTRDGHVESCFGVEEDFRAGVADEIEQLRSRGLDVWLASGDRAHKVARAAEQLGIPDDHALGDLAPDDKARLVKELGSADTLMVGDGLNDAPAFDVAGCAGTPALDRPVMPGRSDFFYVGAGVGAVTAVLDAAHRFHAVVRRNLWLAGIYNAVALTFCFAGFMSPWLVAVLMPISSLVLIANTMSGIGAHRAVAKSAGGLA
ncbi:MAG: HAD-IC family P-type ATPase, partial [Planctomycetes bacterium]|nr:HAD-IC family P-type ATPase [Planctomycetota bacterium]